MDKCIKHIAYYTKKANEEMQKRRPTYTGTVFKGRYKRLMQYKEILNELITELNAGR